MTQQAPWVYAQERPRAVWHRYLVTAAGPEARAVCGYAGPRREYCPELLSPWAILCPACEPPADERRPRRPELHVADPQAFFSFHSAAAGVAVP